MSRPTPDEISPDKQEAPLPSYAAAFWRYDAISVDEAVVTVGCSMPSNSNTYLPYAESWKKKLPSPIKFKQKIQPLPSVEEARTAEPHEAAWNDVMEREVADRLLLFAHRALFGQCSELFNAFSDSVPVDYLLVFGPALPKFTGRICYSHMRREKTVAVIAPDCSKNIAPTQSNQGWEDIEPSPPFSVDCAARKWEKLGKSELSIKTGESITSFQLVVPTGDGFNSVPITNNPLERGQTLWKGKAEIIQRILMKDRQLVRLASWGNAEIYLPDGLACAARAGILKHYCAVMKPAQDIDLEFSKRIAGDLSTKISNYNAMPSELKGVFEQTAVKHAKILANNTKIVEFVQPSHSSQEPKGLFDPVTWSGLAAKDLRSEKVKLLEAIPEAIDLAHQELIHTLGYTFFESEK